MGTRSLTVFQESGQDVCVMYRQFDGYPSGHGRELCEFLKDFTIVNGFNSDTKPPAANGIGCLAAQTIATFKEGIGGIYIEPCGSRDCGQDYIYIVSHESGQLRVQCLDYHGKELFSGTPSKFLDWCKNN